MRRAEPDPVRKARYDAVFSVYTSLYPALRDPMHALAALRGAVKAGD